jgi:hypothetical protein
MADELVAESYQANTVEELREELRNRDLPTSGHKDELIARLEENDAAAMAEEAPAEAEARAEKEEVAVTDEVPDYYPPTVYSQYELPANTAAAQAFATANPDSVTQDELEPGRHELALANIQDHVDQMAASGVTVEDPRLEGYVPGPHIDSLSPASAATGEQVTITVNGSGFNETSTVEVDGSAEATTFVDARTLTVDHRSTTPSGTEIFTVRNGDDQESNNVPFNVTAVEE